MMPTEQPIKIPGKNRPAGTQTPYVMIVKPYQTEKYINMSMMGIGSSVVIVVDLIWVG